MCNESTIVISDHELIVMAMYGGDWYRIRRIDDIQTIATKMNNRIHWFVRICGENPEFSRMLPYDGLSTHDFINCLLRKPGRGEQMKLEESLTFINDSEFLLTRKNGCVYHYKQWKVNDDGQ